MLTYALFPQVALDFFKERQAGFPKKKAAEEAAKAAKEAAKNAPKAAPQSEAPAQIKYVPLPAPFLHSYPGVVGEDALPYIDPAPKAGDRIEGSATFDGKAVDFKVDCLG